MKNLINENEKKVLIFMAESYDSFGGGGCYYFKTIADDVKLEIKQVRRACRSLKKKGFAEYIRGLFDEDGMVAGSGYCCTNKGAELVKIINPQKLI